MRIDAHQHYWQLSRGDYGWLTPEAGDLHQDYLPKQLAPLLQQHNIDKSIVVQAASTIAETEFLLELCQQEINLAGVVGWLDLESENFAEQLRRLMHNPYFIGVRPSFRKNERGEFILNQRIIDSLELLAERNIPIDLLIESQQLVQITDIIKSIPQLRAVLNHLGNPAMGDNKSDVWWNDLEGISKLENVYCKLSGMVTRIIGEQDPAASLQPYVQHVLNCFGTERVMYGSDWPVCLLACSYEETINVLYKTLPNLSEKQLNQIFGLNAERFYRL
ncbi:amidohydrolase [Paenibacillus psychroresistens]|uniref:Amidohydrolase n=1 Tax=Paenibacillus psychroresistens TaxID=1778678 RepID=A0A6B8RI31_9BACL|nr:amidohydrolase family protein [Paenibacillus psychroresistens]QGQ96111.1 amidohydrolase [Paenibacillus psychroresistens]